MNRTSTPISEEQFLQDIETYEKTEQEYVEELQRHSNRNTLSNCQSSSDNDEEKNQDQASQEEEEEETQSIPPYQRKKENKPEKKACTACPQEKKEVSVRGNSQNLKKTPPGKR